MPKPTRIIDIHQHVFWHGRDDAAMVANLDEQGIEKAVLLTWLVGALEREVGYDSAFNPASADPDRFHPGLPLSDVVLARRRFPDRFIAGFCPHPADGKGLERLDAAIRMYDVRACGEWKFRLHLDDPRCIELFRFCATKSLPVILHIDVPYLPDAAGKLQYVKEWYGGTADNLERALRACPETIFLAHGPGFWREISGDADRAAAGYPAGKVAPGGRLVRLMDECPNLYGDLSAMSGRNALQRDPAHGREFLLRFHRRLCFGRDDYDGNLHQFLQTLDLPAEVVENVYHRNAERLLRI